VIGPSVVDSKSLVGVVMSDFSGKMAGEMQMGIFITAAMVRAIRFMHTSCAGKSSQWDGSHRKARHGRVKARSASSR
jgi:hypothetical protein